MAYVFVRHIACLTNTYKQYFWNGAKAKMSLRFLNAKYAISCVSNKGMHSLNIDGRKNALQK